MIINFIGKKHTKAINMKCEIELVRGLIKAINKKVSDNDILDEPVIVRENIQYEVKDIEIINQIKKIHNKDIINVYVPEGYCNEYILFRDVIKNGKYTLTLNNNILRLVYKWINDKCPLEIQ